MHTTHDHTRPGTVPGARRPADPTHPAPTTRPAPRARPRMRNARGARIAHVWATDRDAWGTLPDADGWT